MRWREVFFEPKPAEISFLFVLLIVVPLYVMVRFHPDVAEGGVPHGREAKAIRLSPGTHAGEIPFRIDDIDPAGTLQVRVHPPVRIAYSANRDIFRFAPPKTVARPPRPAPTPRPTPVVQVPASDAGASATPPKERVPPIEGFTFIGLITTENRKVAVLRKDEALFLGGQDDTIVVRSAEDKDGKKEGDVKEYKVLEVRPDRLVMGYPGKDYRQEIKFEGDTTDEKEKRGRRER